MPIFAQTLGCIARKLQCACQQINEVMKQLFLGYLVCAFILICLPFNSSAQFGFNIDTVYISPDNPSDTDEIKVIFGLGIYSDVDYTGATGSILGNQLTVEACFGLLPLGTTAYIEDTISFGQLSAGNYDLNFKAKGSYTSAPYCNTATDSGEVDLNFSIGFLNSSLAATQTELKVYPVVTHDNVTIEFGNQITNKIHLFDINGQAIEKFDIQMNDTQSILNLSSLPNGMYFLHIYLETETKCFKVIKR